MTSAGVPALSARGLSIGFGSEIGLAAIDLDVASGERLALLGPSGSGKTSLLRSLAGLQPLVAGTIAVGSVDVTARAPEQRGIVYMHQAPSLFPHLSVLRNVTFPLDVRGWARSDADRRGRDWLSRVRLDAFADRAPSTLSGGQRHRVALARALAADPRVLLLDEPFASLDPELRADVRDAVVEVLSASDAPATIVVTHDVDEAAALGSRVAILLDGGLAQSGPPAEVFARPASATVARFLGTTNLLPAERDTEGLVHSLLGTWPSPGLEGSVYLAVRPGHVRLHSGDYVPPSGCRVATATAVVESLHERVSGTFLRLRWPSRPGVAPWLAAVSGTAPCPGEAVLVEIEIQDVHVIERTDEEPGDVR